MQHMSLEFKHIGCFVGGHFRNIKTSINSSFWVVKVSQRPAMSFPSFETSVHQEIYLNASLMDEIVCVVL